MWYMYMYMYMYTYTNIYILSIHSPRCTYNPISLIILTFLSLTPLYIHTCVNRNTKEKVKVALSVATVKEFIDDQYIPAELVSCVYIVYA